MTSAPSNPSPPTYDVWFRFGTPKEPGKRWEVTAPDDTVHSVYATSEEAWEHASQLNQAILRQWHAGTALDVTPSSPIGLLQQLGRLTSLLKYGLIFGVLLLVLPLSGIEGVALNGMTGNLFVELSPTGVFWASLFLIASAWSVMLISGLNVNAVGLRTSPMAQSYRTRAELIAAPSRRIPEWAERLFSIPITLPQLLIFTALAVPGLVVMVWYAVRYEPERIVADPVVVLTAAGAALAGVLTA
jgi:hypothetical protein